jgi:glycerate 2-kinase
LPADQPGSGAAGGLGFGLLAGLGARLVPGSAAVGDLIGLDGALADADVVLTGEGRLDATTTAGKVVGHVAARSAELAPGAEVFAVVGRDELDPAHRGELGLDDVEAASPDGPGEDPAGALAAAAARIAARVGATTADSDDVH